MPTSPTYPGVYLEEIPSGVRTITGVATSIAAFIGRATRGPANEPITINSFGDFERIFGGLWVGSTLGFAVRDFYLNGGSQAVVIRLYHAEAGTNAKPAQAKLTADSLALEAASPGAWGNLMRVRIDHNTRPLQPGETADSLFNLTVRDGETGSLESFRNVSITAGHPRQIDKVLLNESQFVRVTGNLPNARPAKSNDPAAGKDPWEDNQPATNYKVATAGEASDGIALTKADDFTPANAETNKKGLYALAKADLFNLLCIPPYLASGNVDTALISEAAVYCERRRAMLLVDPPAEWTTKDQAKSGVGGLGTTSKNAALYFPRLRQPNLLKDNQLEEFVPCGAVAGIFARTDAQRGVWKAPAGLEATLVGVPGLSVPLNDPENGELNPLGINCLRVVAPAGPLVWGARTLQGDDRFASEWKYVPVRRMALFIEESLYRGTQWVVFEPNDAPLWAQIRLNIGGFMHTLFRQGAFQGQTPLEAYFVKCDKETTTQADINLGIVNIVVGFAPLKPAEFVIIKLQQMAGQIQT
jgi:phage tail sheath protein FI